MTNCNYLFTFFCYLALDPLKIFNGYSIRMFHDASWSVLEKCKTQFIILDTFNISFFPKSESDILWYIQFFHEANSDFISEVLSDDALYLNSCPEWKQDPEVLLTVLKTSDNVRCCLWLCIWLLFPVMMTTVAFRCIYRQATECFVYFSFALYQIEKRKSDLTAY